MPSISLLSSFLRLFSNQKGKSRIDLDAKPPRPRTHKERLKAKVRRKIAHESRRRNRAA